jgi:hypothetical protein
VRGCRCVRGRDAPTAAAFPGSDARDAAQCARVSGRWIQVGKARHACVVRAPDAGTSCSGSAQCAGRCLADPVVTEGAEVHGVCSADYVVWGCHQRVENGRAQPEICVD